MSNEIFQPASSESGFYPTPYLAHNFNFVRLRLRLPSNHPNYWMTHTISFRCGLPSAPLIQRPLNRSIVSINPHRSMNETPATPITTATHPSLPNSNSQPIQTNTHPTSKSHMPQSPGFPRGIPVKKRHRPGGLLGRLQWWCRGGSGGELGGWGYSNRVAEGCDYCNNMVCLDRWVLYMRGVRCG